MRKTILAGAGCALLGAGAALAQTPPAPPPAGAPTATTEAAPTMPPGGPGMRPPGRPGWMRGYGHHGTMMPPPQRAAAFRFERDGMEIRVRCAESESTRACVDAAGSLIDKVASLPAAPR